MTNRTMWVKIEEVDFDLNTPTMVVAEGRALCVTRTAADNGSIFKLVFDEDDPTKVSSFSVLAQALAVTDGPSLVEVTTAALAT